MYLTCGKLLDWSSFCLVLGNSSGFLTELRFLILSRAQFNHAGSRLVLVGCLYDSDGFPFVVAADPQSNSEKRCHRFRSYMGSKEDIGPQTYDPPGVMHQESSHPLALP